MTARVPKKAPVRWGALLAALTTVAGILSLPEVLALLPAEWATVIIAVGAAAQALTKPAVRLDHERKIP